MRTVDIPKNVYMLLEKLHAAGFRADIVGGCVRDVLLGLTPNDFDITTSATPSEMQQIFSDMRTVETGLKHGTLTVLANGEPYEITTYRLDGDYADHRHPNEVSFTTELADDLRRRDFTVNAMCYHPDRGLTDLFGGQDDLRTKTLRCVGDAAVRFEEDALRILRALRFSATLGFSIEEQTASAIRDKAHLLRMVSAERIYTEIKKLFMGKNAISVLTEYMDIFSEILNIFPKKQINIDIFEHLPTFSLRFVSMFSEEESGVLAFISACDRLRTDNELRRTGERLLPQCRTATGERRDMLSLLHALGAEDAERLLCLRFAIGTDKVDRRGDLRVLLSEKPVYTLRSLAIRGEDVASLGYRGEEIGRILAQALGAVMDGVCSNTKNDLMAFITRATNAREGGTYGL